MSVRRDQLEVLVEHGGDCPGTWECENCPIVNTIDPYYGCMQGDALEAARLLLKDDSGAYVSIWEDM